ncbi:hypothetical protein T440DRAFT_512010 [Plenodomus tracheiphilus IPT5]|uniref:Uncharacterized protein n=1 Tax=Plenodomus tracheiphilus IPT5 TaxID=1408161 RepID=A0A6A7ARM3_9PLEO|nr:hypothetical protein T440DRAFT_512010 [Plenodomus tracheiphilus IPT5]
MVRLDSFVALSAFGLSALAHPTIKHIDRRFCAVQERNVFARDQLTTRAAIPKATTWNPPSNMVTALDQVWKQTMKENSQGLQDENWITDQLIANNGSINYCKWFDVLVGFEGFPLTTLDVNVVGYAVKNKDLLEGDLSGLDVYTTTDGDGVPECDPRCYRAIHLNRDFSQCPGGAKSRYDISLWLDDTLEAQFGGYGYNWGQELGPDYVLDNLETDNIHILLHEMGHGFGLLDFYDWVPHGQTNFVMMAGSAMEITEFDAWMLRDWWRKLKAARGW